jgi:hypothetical protein
MSAAGTQLFKIALKGLNALLHALQSVFLDVFEHG